MVLFKTSLIWKFLLQASSVGYFLKYFIQNLQIIKCTINDFVDVWNRYVAVVYSTVELEQRKTMVKCCQNYVGCQNINLKTFQGKFYFGCQAVCWFILFLIEKLQHFLIWLHIWNWIENVGQWIIYLEVY